MFYRSEFCLLRRKPSLILEIGCFFKILWWFHEPNNQIKSREKYSGSSELFTIIIFDYWIVTILPAHSLGTFLLLQPVSNGTILHIRRVLPEKLRKESWFSDFLQFNRKPHLLLYSKFWYKLLCKSLILRGAHHCCNSSRH